MTCASFDVFDTCLVRRLAAPTEVFRVVGLNLARDAGMDDPAGFADLFVEWRCEAERRSYEHRHGEDTTLGAIWEELRRLAGPGPVAGAGPSDELRAERAHLGPQAAVLARVARERLAGHRIIFISDTCLPSDFLGSCLRTHGFLEEGDAVYASGEIGLSKRTGALFRHVLEREQLAPGELVHLGDNPLADHDAPAALGIRAELLARPAPPAAEEVLLHRRPSAATAWTAGAGELRFLRLAGGGRFPAAESSITALVEGYLGPIFCLFSHWVLRRAGRAGVKRLYFVSRDTRLAWRVARVLAGQGHPSIDCRYLHVSRRAVYLPSATGIDEAGMPWLRHAADDRTLRRIAAKLETDFGRLAGAWLERRPGWAEGRPLETEEDWQLLWNLLGQASIAAEIRAAIEVRRGEALAYFREAGLLDGTPAALVDLGSLLYTQEAVNRLCTGGSERRPVGGFYLFLRRWRRGPAESGPAEAVFRQGPCDLPETADRRWLERSAVLEHVLGLADHASVEGYTREGGVRYAAAEPAVPKAVFESIESSLVAYAESFGPCWLKLEAESAGAAVLSELLTAFVERPDPAAVAALAPVSYPEDFAHRQNRPLVEALRWAEVFRSREDRLWPEAALAVTPPAIRNARRLAGLLRRLARG